jgi:hypothetical protein
MAAGGELWEEKRVGLKPLLPMPSIIVFHEVIAQGHMKERAKEKGLVPKTWSFGSMQE